jgi:hypothetical protein
VVEELLHGDLDAELQRVTAAGRHAVRPERRVDVAAATSVLLPLHLAHDVLNLDDVDQLGLLELARHRVQLVAALRTKPSGIVELADEVGLLEVRLVQSGRGRCEASARSAWSCLDRAAWAGPRSLSPSVSLRVP